MRQAKPKITEAQLQDARDELLTLEKLSLTELKDLWIQNADHDYGSLYLEQEVLPYKWEDPLYMKMIHRFRNCQRRIAQFFHQIDINNQQRLLSRYLPEAYRRDRDAAVEMVTFMAWLSNMLGRHDVKDLNVDLWDSKPIEWFFQLAILDQKKFIERYNREEVRAYNSMIDSRSLMNYDNYLAFIKEQQTDALTLSDDDESL